MRLTQHPVSMPRTWIEVYYLTRLTELYVGTMFLLTGYANFISALSLVITAFQLATYGKTVVYLVAVAASVAVCAALVFVSETALSIHISRRLDLGFDVPSARSLKRVSRLASGLLWLCVCYMFYRVLVCGDYLYPVLKQST